MKIVFGPVNSRRFGASLGVDLSPARKQCNFDCVYCELKPARPVPSAANAPKISEILEQVQAAFAKNSHFDFITLTANGEPSLYPQLSELVNTLNTIKLDKKLLILSNGTAVLSENARQALLGLDVVKFSLDSVVEKTFFKIDRALKSVNLAAMVVKMAEFRAEFSGQLVMEVLVVQGFNDSEAEFAALNEVFSRIKPDRIDISSIDRPSAYPVKAVSEQRLESLATLITAAPVLVAKRENKGFTKDKMTFSGDKIGFGENKFSEKINFSESKFDKKINFSDEKIDFSEDELLKMLSLRPQSEFDIEAKFSEISKKNLRNLLENSKILVQELAGVKFYRA